MICKNCGKMVLPKDGHILDYEFFCSDCAIECHDCGEIILKDSAYKTADEYYICDSCLDDDYRYCDDCGEIFKYDEVTWIENDEKYICDSCLDEGEYYSCECCEKYFSKDGLERTYDNNWVCDDCRCNDYYYCNDCGRATHRDDCHYIEYRDADYCPNCYENHGCEDYIYSYHDFDCFSKRKTADEPLTNEYFGFELEVSGNRDYAEEFLDQVSDVVLMNDSSIENGGFEIVTQPMTRRYFKERFKPMFEKGLKFLDQNGFYGHGMGGMHVHVSADVFSKRQIAQMAEILYGNEDDRNIWFCISQRKEKNMEEWSCMTDRNRSFDEIVNYEYGMPKVADDRHTALNFDSRTFTYEIRIFNSNTRIERVVKNMECVFALVDYTRQEVDNPYKCNTRGFINFVFDNRLEYPYLYAFLLERRVEEHFGIKYTEKELEAA